jgi:hypothetical protein
MALLCHGVLVMIEEVLFEGLGSCFLQGERRGSVDRM